MNAIIEPQGVESLLLSILLKGQPRACALAFCRVEGAIWACIARQDSAESIGRCIELALTQDQESTEPARSTTLEKLYQSLSAALASMREPDPELLLAYCDDVMRFAATVWQSWQDGYDAGWEDFHRSTLPHAGPPRMDS